MSSFTKTLIVDVDGSGDYETIKEAADYLGTIGGGTIIVEQGTYVLDDIGNRTTVDIYNNTNIIGTGNVVIRITAQNIAAFKNANSSNTNIKISGFKIIYDCPDDPPSYPYLEMHLVYLTNCSKCRLKNLTITSNDRSIDHLSFAICITCNTANTVWGNVIEGCRIYDFGSSSTGYYGGGIMISGGSQLINPQYNIIKNNIISQVGSISGDDEEDEDKYKGCGMLIFYVTTNYNPEEDVIPNNMIISNNIIFDVKGNHSCGFSAEAINNYVVKGNIFNACNKHGFYPSGTSKCAAFGNISLNNVENGIHLRCAAGPINTEYHALTGNVCMNNSEVGIHAQNGTNYSTIFGCQCDENKLGIRIQHETDLDKHPELHPANNCVVGNVAANNTDPGVGDVDISVDEYDKQIVANNIGNLNL